jgi:NADH-quinone oxidoreductase subunit N
MTGRLEFLYPEIALFSATCVVMVLGLSRRFALRKASAWVGGLGLVVAGLLSATTPHMGRATCPITGLVFHEGMEQVLSASQPGQVLLPEMVPFVKAMIAAVGLVLLAGLAGTVDRQEEERIARRGLEFDPLRSNRAEFYAFFLFSLTGLMLTAGADDLIWLFLALELTSLPTYIMVAISTGRNRSREAAVKYFFLGALGAAVFLYGFALIYGATGQTNLNEISAHFREHGVSSLALAGVLLAMLGMCFKIAAVPMHFYTPDVYEGAAPQVSAMLAFVPKTGGFVGILLLAAALGWTYSRDATGIASLLSGEGAGPVRPGGGTQLPEVVRLVLWVIAALTMTVGNAMALLQSNVKRLLAYSSIAHSGYMLVGVIAGPQGTDFTRNGVSAVLFYLGAYAIANAGAFIVLAALERGRDAEGEVIEIERLEDLRGLCAARPLLGWVMVVCSLSLLGLPPLLGFWGKVPLFTAAIAAGEVPLVIVLGVNSAVGAYYYLRLAFAPLLEACEAGEPLPQVAPFRARVVGAGLSLGAVLVLSVAGGALMARTADAGRYMPLPDERHPLVADPEAPELESLKSLPGPGR